MNKMTCSSETANFPSPIETITLETYNITTDVAANIAVGCVICEEYTPVNYWDHRTHGVFICDKCKAAIMHIRNTLENV